MENAIYLFAAFGIIWALLFGYVLVLFRKQHHLKREIDSINKLLREKKDQA